jgi:hypothetical protein
MADNMAVPAFPHEAGGGHPPIPQQQPTPAPPRPSPHASAWMEGWGKMRALNIAAEILLGIGATLLFLAFVREFFTFAPS